MTSVKACVALLTKSFDPLSSVDGAFRHEGSPKP